MHWKGLAAHHGPSLVATPEDADIIDRPGGCSIWFVHFPQMGHTNARRKLPLPMGIPEESALLCLMTGPDEEAAANRRARSASNLASTSSEVRGRRPSTAHVSSGLGRPGPHPSTPNGLSAPAEPAAQGQGHQEGPHPMDIDVPALPKLRVHPSSAPPTRTGNTDMGLGECGTPMGSLTATSVPTPRLTRSATQVEPAQRAARTGDAPNLGQAQPSGSGAAPAMRVLPQRQGLHTPRGASASTPQGQRATGASQAPGEGGPTPAPGGAEALPGSSGRILGPSSPRARSSGGPHSPRSPRAVTSPSDRKTRAGAYLLCWSSPQQTTQQKLSVCLCG